MLYLLTVRVDISITIIMSPTSHTSSTSSDPSSFDPFTALFDFDAFFAEQARAGANTLQGPVSASAPSAHVNSTSTSSPYTSEQDVRFGSIRSIDYRGPEPSTGPYWGTDKVLGGMYNFLLRSVTRLTR